MKNFKLFRLLALFAVLITTISQSWGYTFYLYTGNFSSWENKGDGVNPKFQVYVNSKNYDFTSLGNHWYSVEVGNASGTAYVKRCKSSDGTKWNEFSATISSSMNVAFVSDWNSGYFRPMKTYDGQTYVYWKVAGNSIPSWWYSGAHKVQMLKYTTGYTGYQTGENLGDNIIRYLVPSGTYADIEVQREDANYSGKFSFDTDAAKNIIYSYSVNGGSGSWSTTYFAYNAYVYFDNSANLLTDTYKHMIVGRDNTNKYSNCYALTNISNTKLWCYTSTFSFNDYDGLRFIGTATDDWGEYNGQGPSERTGYTNRSGSSPQLMDHSSRAYNLFWTTSSSNDAALSHSANSSYSGLLHSTQTVNIQISRDGGTNWITAPKAPAKVTLHSFALTNATTSAASNATDIAVDATTVSQSTTAARTATTTLAYESKKVGYTFVGWFKNGTSQGTGSSLDYYPTDATTHTARFKAHRYTVVFNGRGNTSGSMTDQSFTYEVAQNLRTNTFVKEGYTFQGWATSLERAAAGTVDYANDVDGSTMAQATSDNCTINLYAVWADDGTYYFDGNGGESTAWATAANWTKGAVPGSTSDVIILKPVVVTANTTTTVNSIKIATEGSYTPNGGSEIEASGKLTIPAEAMLVVTTNVQNYNLSTSATTATTAATLHIEAGNITTNGNGALVWGTSGTPGEAQVDFCTKSQGAKNDEESVNQYIGTPFSNDQSILYQYYYSWLFKIKRADGEITWDLMSGDESMNEFEGYNLITAYDKGTTYQMEGTLVSNADVTLSTSSDEGLPKLYYSSTGGSDINENVLANSWVAPIKIKNMNVSGVFTNIDASIYIFNAGSVNDAANKETLAGNYSTYSVGTANDTDVIPSMQSFSVYANAASPVLFLDYSEIVQKDASNSLIISNKAPQREAETSEEMNLLKVRIEGENGWADELKIFIHDEFSNAFENGWDAHKMYGYPEAPQLYAVTTDGNMAINCVPTADNNVLGFTPGSEDNDYTFSFTYDGDEEYYLKDTKLNIETLINTEATYTFTSEAEDSDMRFIIIKRAPAVATDAETVSGDQLAVSGVQKIMHNGQLYIIRDGGIYSTDGQKVK